MAEKFEEQLAQLEAVLYSAGRPISLTTIVAHLRLLDEKHAQQLVEALGERYREHGSPLEVRRMGDDRVVLQLKSEYVKEARRYSIKPPLTAGPLRTLSFIAYNQPIEKKAVAEARGSQSYQHVKELEEMGLIRTEKAGRTEVIETTDDFADYLGLSRDRGSMKRQLRVIFKRLEESQPKKPEQNP